MAKGVDRGWALAFPRAPLHPGSQTSLGEGAQAQHARHTPLRANPLVHFPRNPPIFKMYRRICLLPPTASPPPCAQVVDEQEPGAAGWPGGRARAESLGQNLMIGQSVRLDETVPR